MRILFKYPSRSRPERFFQGLDSIIHNLADKVNFEIQVTADTDDPTMTDRAVYDKIISYPNTHILYGYSKSKIHAVNRNLEEFKDWDIVVLMSDDVRWTFYGFDSIIRSQFEDGDFDKYVHILDQDAKHLLSVIYIAGKDFVKRFGYLYNPIYKSLFCDNEIHEQAVMLGKYKLVDVPGLLLHLNPAYGHLPRDPLFEQQQAIGWDEDQKTYNRRKAENFRL